MLNKAQAAEIQGRHRPDYHDPALALCDYCSSEMIVTWPCDAARLLAEWAAMLAVVEAAGVLTNRYETARKCADEFGEGATSCGECWEAVDDAMGQVVRAYQAAGAADTEQPPSTETDGG